MRGVLVMWQSTHLSRPHPCILQHLRGLTAWTDLLPLNQVGRAGLLFVARHLGFLLAISLRLILIPPTSLPYLLSVSTCFTASGA